ncbi:MAG: cell division protein FtsQ/DivIB, partial [Pseudomonadota bacterium]
LIDLLGSEPDLKKRVSGAVWISDRRWNLQMDGRIEVRLPEGDMSAAWQQLAEVEREHGVFERDVKIIDMRIPDRLVVRTSPDAKPLSHPSDDEEST